MDFEIYLRRVVALPLTILSPILLISSIILELASSRAGKYGGLDFIRSFGLQYMSMWGSP